MTNLMKYKLLYFIFSVLIILPGLYFLFTAGLKLGIDFTGGALLEYEFERNIPVEDLRKEITNKDIEVGQIITAGENSYIIRTKPLDQEKISEVKKDLNEKFGTVEVRRE